MKKTREFHARKNLETWGDKKKNGMRWNQGERRGIITQMQLLSTRKEDGHQPLSTATRQQGNERKVHKGNVFGTESRG